jgi:hypothetical protein
MVEVLTTAVVSTSSLSITTVSGTAIVIAGGFVVCACIGVALLLWVCFW